jgi:hypothetical protein
MRRFRTATLTGWGFPGSERNLNSSNRPVRTRMPGGVAGDWRGLPSTPMPIFCDNDSDIYCLMEYFKR